MQIYPDWRQIAARAMPQEVTFAGSKTLTRFRVDSLWIQAGVPPEELGLSALLQETTR
jgi:hypothetical protein